MGWTWLGVFVAVDHRSGRAAGGGGDPDWLPRVTRESEECDRPRTSAPTVLTRCGGRRGPAHAEGGKLARNIKRATARVPVRAGL
jgi:hypothetical protein